jgi:hypothetical protein
MLTSIHDQDCSGSHFSWHGTNLSEERDLIELLSLGRQLACPVRSVRFEGALPSPTVRQYVFGEKLWHVGVQQLLLPTMFNMPVAEVYPNVIPAINASTTVLCWVGIPLLRFQLRSPCYRHSQNVLCR